ncbi:MAG TPA: HAMP domain-containing sensor histidine kinase [Anaerolineales bacterium]|nr:HAMP domain-containing sensor histidine kinase [Anaerolineales bacterium]
MFNTIYEKTEDWEKAYQASEEVNELLFIQRVTGFANLQQYLQHRVREEDYAQTSVEYQNLIETTEELDLLSLDNDELISLLLHDIANPLGAVLQTLQMVEETQDETTPQQRHARYQRCYNALNSILQILENTTSIITQEKPVIAEKITLQRLDIVPFLKEITANFQTIAQTKQQRVILECSFSNLLVFANPHQLTRVLDNLLSNASKYSKPNTNIFIYAIKQQDKLIIEVKDFGLGISKKEQANLFRKYGKTSNSPTKGESSSGLGLYGARKLARAMNGDLSAFSAGKDLGSSFYLFLNCAYPNPVEDTPENYYALSDGKLEQT